MSVITVDPFASVTLTDIARTKVYQTFSDSEILALILATLNGGGGGSGIAAQKATLAPPVMMGANQTASIPAGAKGYQISITSGTATVKGTAGITPGTISSTNTTAASITVITADNSSAILAWET